MKVIYQSRKFNKYEFEDIFEKDKFIECSEEYFDNTVVRFRDQWTLTYHNGYQEFTDTTGLRIRRYYA